jgi:sigma-E factor negative regulatory protein RseA
VERTALTGGARTGQVLRAQGIDEYLMAHQRFSPSVYSSAQYARSATFANESGK